MHIAAPKYGYNDPDYMLECEEALDVAVREIVDQATQAGWSTRRVLVALVQVAANQASTLR